jgi:cytochrome c
MMKLSIQTMILAGAFVAAPAIADVELATNNGCLGCHQIETKVVGPAWKDVAAKVSDRARLVDSIKNGSQGKWAEITGGMAMPANSPRVSDADIEKLADFILTLK